MAGLFKKYMQELITIYPLKEIKDKDGIEWHKLLPKKAKIESDVDALFQDYLLSLRLKLWPDDPTGHYFWSYTKFGVKYRLTSDRKDMMDTYYMESGVMLFMYMKKGVKNFGQLLVGVDKNGTYTNVELVSKMPKLETEFFTEAQKYLEKFYAK